MLLQSDDVTHVDMPRRFAILMLFSCLRRYSFRHAADFLRCHCFRHAHEAFFAFAAMPMLLSFHDCRTRFRLRCHCDCYACHYFFFAFHSFFSSFLCHFQILITFTLVTTLRRDLPRHVVILFRATRRRHAALIARC